MIAPSRNLLSPTAFKKRHLPRQIDEKVQRLVKENRFHLPITSSSLPITNHCFAASLHFVKRYQQTQSIQVAAQSMINGMDEECGRTAALHDDLFYGNKHQVVSEKDAREFGDRLSRVVAGSIDLTITSRTHLKYPIEEVIPYIKNGLPAGEYLIPFPTHVLALVKDSNGVVTIFDTNQGTVHLSDIKSEKWFLELLKKYRVHLSEKVTFSKIEGGNSADKIVESDVKFNEEPPALNFEKGKGRWGVAVFKWRGVEHRFPWDSITGHIYNKNSMKLLRIKHFMLTSRNWIDNSLRIIYHAATAALNILKLPVAALKGRISKQIGSICQSTSEIFRVALFTLMGTCAAFYGIFNPLEGRRIYGYLERSLNEQNHQVDISKRYYIAPCYTPINHGQKETLEANINAIKKVVLKEQSFKGCTLVEVFCGWRKALPCCKG